MKKRIYKIISFYKLLHKKRLLLIIFGGILASISILANMVYPLIVKNIIESIEEYNMINYDLFILLGILYISVILISYIGEKIYNKNKYKAAEEIRRKIFKKSFYFPGKNFQEKGSAYYSDLINNQVNNAFVVLDYVFIQNIFLLSRATIILGIIFKWNKLLFILFLVNFILVILYSYLLNKLTSKNFENIQELGRKITSYIVETFDNIYEILAGKAKNKRIKTYSSIAKAITNQSINAEYTRVKLNIFLLEIPELLTKFFILFYCSRLVLNNQMSIGMVWAVWTFFGFVINPISIFKTFSKVILESGITINKVLQYFNKAIKAENKYKTNHNAEKSKNLFNIKELTISHNDNNKILNNINLKLKKNNILGVIGLSGEGKTTLLNVLLGFERNYKGSVKLLGENLKHLSPEYIFDKIALYSQSSGILNQKLEENIVMGREYKKEKVETIINKLNLTHLQNRLLGERGSFISGGEKQKVFLARFLYAEKPFFIIDEPFTNLDSINEDKFKNILNNYIQDKTGVIISHKFNIIQLADKHIVLNNGKIVEQGTLENIIKNNILVKNLVEKYLENTKLDNTYEKNSS